MSQSAVERIRREEYTQQELLRMFKEAASEAMSKQELMDAWYLYADNLTGSYREDAQDWYALQLRRLGVTPE